MLRFSGAQHLRQRLVCATLSGRPIRIDDIRAADQEPGLNAAEASLLRLIEKISNGCSIEINETGARGARVRRMHACTRNACMRLRARARALVRHAARAATTRPWFSGPSKTALLCCARAAGTSLRYRPGLIAGGASVVHDCGTTRAIGYFLEPLVVLALFGKKVRARGFLALVSSRGQPHAPASSAFGVRQSGRASSGGAL